MPDNLKNTPMADTMEFIETPTFTRQDSALLPDDDYRGLQNELIEDPERGDIIKGGGVSAKYAMQQRGMENVAASELSTTGYVMTVRFICCWLTPSQKRRSDG